MSELYIPITMTSKGTFTLPAKIRKEFGLRAAGDQVMLRYRQGSKQVELEAPLDLRALQSEVDKLIPSNIPPLTDVRTFLDDAKTKAWKQQLEDQA